MSRYMPKHRRVNYRRDPLWRMRWETILVNATAKRYR